MKYFIDTEFLEGTQRKGFMGMGKTKPTIDLISIGIVAEDGRDYYAISKDFNLKEAWNRFDLKEIKCHAGDVIIFDKNIIRKDSNTILKKDYWIRDNVLKPIYNELIKLEIDNYKGFTDPYYELELDFTYKVFKRLIKKYGKTNKQIAEELKDFVSYKQFYKDTYQINLYQDSFYDLRMEDLKQRNMLPQFYGYYADYDWVVFCWLFGKMIDLPKGFPMYCIDLKQLLDDKVSNMEFRKQKSGDVNDYEIVKGSTNLQQFLDLVKGEGLVNGTYPKQTNEHNALADARWNYELYKFLNTLNVR